MMILLIEKLIQTFLSSNETPVVNMFTQRYSSIWSQRGSRSLEKIHSIFLFYITTIQTKTQNRVFPDTVRNYTNLKRRDTTAKIRKYTTMQFAVSICSLYASNLNCGFRQSPCFSWTTIQRASLLSTIPTSGKYPRSLPTRTAKLAYYSPMTSSSLFPPSFRRPRHRHRRRRRRRCPRPLLPVLFHGTRLFQLQPRVMEAANCQKEATRPRLVYCNRVLIFPAARNEIVLTTVAYIGGERNEKTLLVRERERQRNGGCHCRGKM